MGEADCVVCKERYRGQSCFLLFGPNEVPRRTHTTISITLQAGRDDFASVKQQVSVDLVACLRSNWRQELHRMREVSLLVRSIGRPAVGSISNVDRRAERCGQVPEYRGHAFPSLGLAHCD